MTAAIWLAARIRCLVSGNRMTQHGRLEQCGRCGACWFEFDEVDL